MFYRPETPPIRAVSFYTVIGSNYLGRRNPETNGVTFMEKLRQLIGRKAVLQLIGLKRTALDEAVARGDFPAPVKMFEGGRKGFWDVCRVNKLPRRCIAYNEKSIHCSTHVEGGTK